MPLIRVKLIEGAVSPEKKIRLITGLTNSFVSVIGKDIRPITWVVLEEVKNGDWGMAGELCIIEPPAENRELPNKLIVPPTSGISQA